MEASAAQQLDIFQFIQELAAIDVKVELDEPVSYESMEEWKYKIQEASRQILAEHFGLSLEQVSLEVEVWEGSLRTKIITVAETLVLILGLYGGVHDVIEHGPKDWEALANKTGEVVQQITNGKDVSVDGYWKRLIKRQNGTDPQDTHDQ